MPSRTPTRSTSFGRNTNTTNTKTNTKQQRSPSANGKTSRSNYNNTRRFRNANSNNNNNNILPQSSNENNNDNARSGGRNNNRNNNNNNNSSSATTTTAKQNTAHHHRMLWESTNFVHCHVSQSDAEVVKEYFVCTLTIPNNNNNNNNNNQQRDNSQGNFNNNNNSAKNANNNFPGSASKSTSANVSPSLKPTSQNIGLTPKSPPSPSSSSSQQQQHAFTSAPNGNPNTNKTSPPSSIVVNSGASIPPPFTGLGASVFDSTSQQKRQNSNNQMGSKRESSAVGDDEEKSTSELSLNNNNNNASSTNTNAPSPASATASAGPTRCDSQQQQQQTSPTSSSSEQVFFIGKKSMILEPTKATRPPFSTKKSLRLCPFHPAHASLLLPSSSSSSASNFNPSLCPHGTRCECIHYSDVSQLSRVTQSAFVKSLKEVTVAVPAKDRPRFFRLNIADAEATAGLILLCFLQQNDFIMTGALRVCSYFDSDFTNNANGINQSNEPQQQGMPSPSSISSSCKNGSRCLYAHVDRKDLVCVDRFTQENKQIDAATPLAAIFEMMLPQGIVATAAGRFSTELGLRNLGDVQGLSAHVFAAVSHAVLSHKKQQEKQQQQEKQHQQLIPVTSAPSSPKASGKDSINNPPPNMDSAVVSFASNSNFNSAPPTASTSTSTSLLTHAQKTICILALEQLRAFNPSQTPIRNALLTFHGVTAEAAQRLIAACQTEAPLNVLADLKKFKLRALLHTPHVSAALMTAVEQLRMRLDAQEETGGPASLALDRLPFDSLHRFLAKLICEFRSHHAHHSWRKQDATRPIVTSVITFVHPEECHCAFTLTTTTNSAAKNNNNNTNTRSNSCENNTNSFCGCDSGTNSRTTSASHLVKQKALIDVARRLEAEAAAAAVAKNNHNNSNKDSPSQPPNNVTVAPNSVANLPRNMTDPLLTNLQTSSLNFPSEPITVFNNNNNNHQQQHSSVAAIPMMLNSIDMDGMIPANSKNRNNTTTTSEILTTTATTISNSMSILQSNNNNNNNNLYQHQQQSTNSNTSSAQVSGRNSPQAGIFGPVVLDPRNQRQQPPPGSKPSASITASATHTHHAAAQNHNNNINNNINNNHVNYLPFSEGKEFTLPAPLGHWCRCNRSYEIAVNYELSTPAGSRCSEQNVMGKIASIGLPTHCIREVFVHGSGAKEDPNPLFPCGVCESMFKRISKDVQDHNQRVGDLTLYMFDQMENPKKLVCMNFHEISHRQGTMFKKFVEEDLRGPDDDDDDDQDDDEHDDRDDDEDEYFKGGGMLSGGEDNNNNNNSNNNGNDDDQVW